MIINIVIKLLLLFPCSVEFIILNNVPINYPKIITDKGILPIRIKNIVHPGGNK